MTYGRETLFARDARDLREKRDWSGASFSQVSPISHVLLVSRAFQENRNSAGACH